MTPTLLFHCQHSLGMGHLVRSLALVEALGERFRVVLLNGGRMPPGIPIPAAEQVVQLPAIGMDGDGALRSLDGRRTLERAQAVRAELVLEAFRETRPQAVVVELFPFGRRKLAGELVPLLEAVHAGGPKRALVVSSLRDILVRGRPDQDLHDERACAWANRYFDAVLVHADPRFARLEESFRPRSPLAVPVHYTGFVARGRHTDPGSRVADGRRLVVSAGGGRVGAPLLSAAVEAHRELIGERDLHTTVIAGPFLPEPDWRALSRSAHGVPRLALRRSVPDLSAELSHADASISQCGYNTALDVLRARCPALLVPFVAPIEDEQLRRAERLERLGLARMLHPDALDGPRLAREIRSLLRFSPRRSSLDLDGAARTSALVEELAGSRRAAVGAIA